MRRVRSVPARAGNSRPSVNISRGFDRHCFSENRPISVYIFRTAATAPIGGTQPLCGEILNVLEKWRGKATCGGQQPLAEIVPNTQPRNFPSVFNDLPRRVISLSNSGPRAFRRHTGTPNSNCARRPAASNAQCYDSLRILCSAPTGTEEVADVALIDSGLAEGIHGADNQTSSNRSCLSHRSGGVFPSVSGFSPV